MPSRRRMSSPPALQSLLILRFCLRFRIRKKIIVNL
jgi:hypothetical protein